MQTISTNLANDTVFRLEEVAENQNRSRADLIQEAVDDYLNSIQRFEAKVKEADESFAAGRFISHEDLKAKYRRLGVKS